MGGLSEHTPSRWPVLFWGRAAAALAIFSENGTLAQTQEKPLELGRPIEGF